MIRRLIYNLFDLFLFNSDYFNIIKDYQLMKKYQYNSIKENSNLQKSKLFNLLNYAIHNIPYYRDLVRKNKIEITKDNVFEDLKKFPVLTKEIIRKNWQKLHTDLSKIKYIINTSGGTTGEPIKLIQDKDYSLKTYSSTLVFDEIGGYSTGDKLIKLWGNEKEIYEQTKSLIHSKINPLLKNIYFQNSFRMSEKIIQNYIDEINNIKPKVIIAYVQSIYEMAKFINRKNLRIHKPHSIITSAGVLTQEIKKVLESVFNCKIHNRYGSREVGLIACSCDKSEKLHINMFQQYIEILDKENTSLNENEKGNIIITNLANYSMPLIRYKIGDIGSLNLSKCLCNRGLIRLNNVHGRIVDVFKNEYGDIIDGEYFTHLFYLLENIKQFQVIQETINQINVNLVTYENNKITKKTEHDIIEKIKLVMGKNCNLTFNYLKEIETPSSGKFRYTISKIK